MTTGRTEFELMVFQGRGLLVIDYQGAREARTAAVLSFDGGTARLDAPGQRRELVGLTVAHVAAISETLQVCEVDPRGTPLRIYACQINLPSRP